jgi:hypothetical protein
MIDKSKPGLWVYESGREVIQKTEAGRRLMISRRNIAYIEANGICCLCEQAVSRDYYTLAHLHGKGSGGGKHDDRQQNLSIAHLAGNSAQGSMSLEQYLKLPLDVRVRNCQ